MAELFIDAQSGEQLIRELTPEEIEALKEPDDVRIARETVEADAKRKAAYTSEADPLFFKWQRGEATEQEWRDKVAEIRARFPYAE